MRALIERVAGVELGLRGDHPPAGVEPDAGWVALRLASAAIAAMLDMDEGAPGRRHAHRCAARGRRARRGPAAGRRRGRLGADRGARAAARGAGRRAARARSTCSSSTRSRAARGAAARARRALLDRPHEELWIHTYEEAAEALLREYSIEAGLDPFFTTVGPADRLAILLDRLDELPLRRHEIRGNPAGLLARLLRRIDLLKAEAVAPAALREWAVARERAAATPAERERAEREIEFADLYARHDRILREAGSLDGGDLVLELGQACWRNRADVAAEVGERFGHVLADELEDAGLAHRAVLEAVARARQPRLRRRPGPGDPALPRRGRGGARGVPRGPPGGRRDRPRRARCARPG